MLEKRFAAVPPQLLSASGTINGIISIADTSLFKVKQHVILSASTLPNLTEIEVKTVLSPTQLVVGPVKGSINTFSDVSAYTTALTSFIFANEQKRPTIGADDFERAVFEEEPVVAKRVILVDKFGNKIDDENPLAVNADVTVNSVQLFTKPYDSITATYPSSTQEIYKSRVGGISGAIQETVTVNYVDSTKNLILNVART